MPRGRPIGTTKDPNRKRVKNHNGRLIDYEGVQYNKLIKSGYKLNSDKTQLILDDNFTGERGIIKPTDKVKNPEPNGRWLKIGSKKFEELKRKFYYDENKKEFAKTVHDPRYKDKQLVIGSPDFQKRVKKQGYIYDKADNSLIKPNKLIDKAFSNSAVEHDFVIVNKQDPEVQMKMLSMRTNYLISKALKRLNGVKFNIGMVIKFVKEGKNNMVELRTLPIITKAVSITHKSQIKNAIRKQMQQITQRIDVFNTGGSGLTVDEVERHYIHMNSYQPLSAKSYVALPSGIQNKKATINIKNKDDKCFMYCLGRALDPNPEKHHLELVSKHLKKVCVDLGLDKIKMPVSMKDIPQIEKTFNISINVFGHTGCDVYPILITKTHSKKHVDLLYTENEETNHYVLIKNFNKLNFKITKHNKKQHFCRYCIQHFSSEKILQEHIPNCMTMNGTQGVELPKEGSKVSFKNRKNMVQVPFVIYADLEALLKSLKNENDAKNDERMMCHTLKIFKNIYRVPMDIKLYVL